MIRAYNTPVHDIWAERENAKVGEGGEFVLPVSTLHGTAMEGAPRTREEMLAATREQWEHVFAFYGMHTTDCVRSGQLQCEEGDLDLRELRDEWRAKLGIAKFPKGKKKQKKASRAVYDRSTPLRPSAREMCEEEDGDDDAVSQS